MKSSPKKTVVLCNKNEQPTIRQKSTDQIKCLYKIANKGESFDLSTKQAVKNAERKLFREILRNGDYYIERNEDNEATNDFAPGEGGSTLDPRKNYFPRFNVIEKVGDFFNYGMVDQEEINFEEFKKKSICKKPRFSIIPPKNFKNYEVFKKNRNYIMKENEVFNIYLNHCRKSISRFKNHCTYDLRMDQQFIDVFHFKKQGKVLENVYCKKSYENEWTLLSSKYRYQLI